MLRMAMKTFANLGKNVGYEMVVQLRKEKKKKK
jgi:hypothetical protein